MSLTRVTFVYNGGPQVFPTNFALGVLETDHVYVAIDGNVDGAGNQIFSNFNYNAATGDVTITDSLTVGDTGVIFREVPINELIVDFEQGEDVTRRNLSRSSKQVLMAVQEVKDQSTTDNKRIDDFLEEVVDSVEELTQTAVDAAEEATTAAETAAEDAAEIAAGLVKADLEAAVAADAQIATTQAGIATTQADIATTQAGIATTQAGIATTQASDASDSALSAADSATSASNSAASASGSAASASDSASSAQSSAIVSGAMLYANTATGIASTSTGEFFYVPEFGGLRAYENNAGTAVAGPFVGQPVFPLRSTLVAAVAAGYAPENGTVVTAGGVQYVRSAGATALPGLPGWLPFGEWDAGHFDAIGDGATDTAARINSALSAASEAGVSVVELRPGVYVLEGPISIPPFVHLRGAGEEAVTLLRKSGTSDFHNVIISGTAETPNVSAKISGVTIDGNRAEVTGGHGIRAANALYWTIQNVTVKNTFDYGIGAQDGVVGGHLIENVTIVSAGNDGIDFKNKGSQPAVRGTIRNVTVRDWSMRVSGKTAIDLRGPHDVEGITLSMDFANAAIGVRCQVDGVDNGPGGKDVLITSVEARTSVANGLAISVANERVSVNGVRIYGAWARGVRVAADTPDATITDAYSVDADRAFEDSGLRTKWIACRAKDPVNECFRINGATLSQFIACECDGGTYGFREFADILQKHQFIGSSSINASVANWSLRGDSTLIAPRNFVGDLNLRDGRDQAWARVEQFDGLENSFLFIPQANVIRADGVAANRDLRLQGKGTGQVRFGAGAAAADASAFSATNYLTMKLDNGSVIRVPYMTTTW